MKSSITSGTVDRPLAGIGFAVTSVAAFSVLDALAKLAVSLLPVFEILAIRGAMVLVALAPLVARAGVYTSLRSRQPWVHVVRGTSSVLALWTFFEALRLLPLATVIALSFSAPLWMTVLSIPILKEHVGPHRWAGLRVGFAGVGIIMGADAAGGALSAGGWLMLGSAFFFGMASLLVRRLVRTDSDLSMLVYQNIAQMLAGIAGSAFTWQRPTPLALAVVAATAVALMAGQWLAVGAMRRAPVGAVAPFHYTALVWAAFYGWAFWGEWPASEVWLGALVVTLAGLYVAWRERLAVRRRLVAGAGT